MEGKMIKEITIEDGGFQTIYEKLEAIRNKINELIKAHNENMER